MMPGKGLHGDCPGTHLKWVDAEIPEWVAAARIMFTLQSDPQGGWAKFCKVTNLSLGWQNPFRRIEKGAWAGLLIP